MSAELQQLANPQPQEGQPSFLQRATETGKQRLEVKKQTRSERWAGFRQRLVDARGAVAGGFRKAGEVVSNTWRLQEAMHDPAMRTEAAQIIGDKVKAGAERVGDTIVNIRDNAVDLGGRAVAGTVDTLSAIGTSANEIILQPALADLNKARKAVAKGAINGTLFTVGLAVGAAEATTSGVKKAAGFAGDVAGAAVDMGAAGVQKGADFVVGVAHEGTRIAGEVKETATQLAEQWGNNVAEFYRDSTQTVKNEVAGRRLDVSASWNRFLASRAEASARRRENRAERRQRQIARKQEVLASIQTKALNSREQANQRRGLAAQRAAAAAQLRNSG